MRPVTRINIKHMKRLMKITSIRSDVFDINPTRVKIDSVHIKSRPEGISYQSKENGFAMQYSANMEARGLVIALTCSAEVVEYYLVELVQKIYHDTFGDKLIFQDPLFIPLEDVLRVRSTGCPVVDLDLTTGRITVEKCEIVPAAKATGFDIADLAEVRGLLYTARML